MQPMLKNTHKACKNNIDSIAQRTTKADVNQHSPLQYQKVEEKRDKEMENISEANTISEENNSLVDGDT